MKKIIVLVTSLFLASVLLAQNTPSDSLTKWKTGGTLSLNASQVSLTNWAAGGENSISGLGMINLFADYKKDKFTWDNTLDLAYGLIRQGDDPVIKSDDKIDFASKAGQHAFNDWYYTGMIGFKSQFAPGYDSPGDSLYISNFLAPAYLNIALGMDYKPSDHFTLFISPLSGKATFVQDEYLSNKGAFGVEPGKEMRPEFGGYIKMMFKHDIMKNVGFQTKLDLFSNYIENPQNIDVNWDVLISMKINEYLSANLTTTLIYDDDILIAVEQDDGSVREQPAIQFKEMFGVGFSYKF